VYRNSDGTGAETTAYSYTWFSDTVQEQSATTNLPVISTAENGSGAAEATATWYNIYGQPTWSMDADGYIDYAAYDPATGAVVKTITDVNTQDTGARVPMAGRFLWAGKGGEPVSASRGTPAM
jgi:hypothetical protein